MDREEILQEQAASAEIPCKACIYALKPVYVFGQKHDRSSFGSCDAFATKPAGILSGDSCPLYKKKED